MPILLSAWSKKWSKATADALDAITGAPCSSRCCLSVSSPCGPTWDPLLQLLVLKWAGGHCRGTCPCHKRLCTAVMLASAGQAWNESCYRKGFPCLNSAWLVNCRLESTVFCPSVPPWKAWVLPRFQFLKQCCLGWCRFPLCLKEKEFSPMCPSLISGHGAVWGGLEHHFRADSYLGGGCCSMQLQWEEEFICHTL